MSLKTKFAAALLVTTLAGQSAGRAEEFFQSGEDYLAARKMNPAIPREVLGSGIKVKVVTPESIERLKKRITDPSLLDELEHLKSRAPSAAPSFRVFLSKAFPDGILKENKPACYIIPMQETATAQQMISDMSHMPERYIENPGLTNEEMNLFIFVHEMRHCPAQYSNEKESDWQGARIIAREFNKPELIDAVTYMRVANTGEYMTSFYVSGMRDGTAAPSADDVSRAQEDVVKLFGHYISDPDIMPGIREPELPIHIKNYKLITRVLEKHRAELSPLAVAWAELFLRTVDHFAPSVKRGAIPIPAPSPG